MYDPKDVDGYYRSEYIKNKIAFECRYREVIVIKRLENKNMTIRPLKIFKPDHFSWIYDRYHLDTCKFDLYISNASVRLPPLPSDPKQLKEAREMLNKNWFDLLTGYDYFVDIDPSSISDESLLIEWGLKIKKELVKKHGFIKNHIDIYKTGSGGVHVVYKGRFDPVFVKETVMDISIELGLPLRDPRKIIDGEIYIPVDGEWVKKKEGEDIPEIKKPFIDNMIYDYRRIRRVPYSVHSSTGKPMRKIFKAV